jgi:hypothetical protein
MMKCSATGRLEVQGEQEGTNQAQKFKDLARELECDEDEAAFDERLKKLAKAPPPKAKAKGE